VALLEPFIDTIVVCTMTGLVIVITGAYSDPANSELIAGSNGAALTSRAMGGQIWWFPYVLSVAVVLFAYSTMISWSYYGERCFVYLFGPRSSMAYKILFLTFVFLGSIITAHSQHLGPGSAQRRSPQGPQRVHGQAEGRTVQGLRQVRDPRGAVLARR
jgi:AGCS family alanine or glycine:cation symporter